MKIKVLIGPSIALMLLAGACAGAPSPSGVPTSVVQPSPAASSAPTAAGAASSASPAPAGTATPAKAEEAREPTRPSGEEAEEGPPKPSPLPPVAPGGNQNYAPVPGADITKNGAAASIHGSAAAGQVVYVQHCQVCHGTEGKGGIPNSGSDDGTVPPLNPIDPGFTASAKGDPATFAREIDLFIQHGSRPAGPKPVSSMVPWGDQNKLTQQQIADVEAYVMQLDGVTWTSR